MKNKDKQNNNMPIQKQQGATHNNATNRNLNNMQSPSSTQNNQSVFPQEQTNANTSTNVVSRTTRGKAVAVDPTTSIDSTKFTNDSELLKWFSGEPDRDMMSGWQYKKAMKKRAKEEKARQKKEQERLLNEREKSESQSAEDQWNKQIASQQAPVQRQTNVQQIPTPQQPATQAVSNQQIPSSQNLPVNERVNMKNKNDEPMFSKPSVHEADLLRDLNTLSKTGVGKKPITEQELRNILDTEIAKKDTVFDELVNTVGGGKLKRPSIPKKGSNIDIDLSRMEQNDKETWNVLSDESLDDILDVSVDTLNKPASSTADVRKKVQQTSATHKPSIATNSFENGIHTPVFSKEIEQEKKTSNNVNNGEQETTNRFYLQKEVSTPVPENLPRKNQGDLPTQSDIVIEDIKQEDIIGEITVEQPTDGSFFGKIKSYFDADTNDTQTEDGYDEFGEYEEDDSMDFNFGTDDESEVSNSIDEIEPIQSNVIEEPIEETKQPFNGIPLEDTEILNNIPQNNLEEDDGNSFVGLGLDDEWEGQPLPEQFDYYDDEIEYEPVGHSAHNTLGNASNDGDFSNSPNTHQSKTNTRPKSTLQAQIIDLSMPTGTGNSDTTEYTQSAQPVDEPYYEEEISQEVLDFENDLVALKKSAVFRTIINSAITILLVCLGLVSEGIIKAGTFISVQENALVFSLISLVLVTILIVYNFGTISDGLKKLFAGTPTVDSPLAIAAIGVLFQSVILFVHNALGSPGETTWFASVAALGFSINGIGAVIHVKAILQNFLLSQDKDIAFAASELKNQDLAQQLTNGLSVSNNSRILYARPTGQVKHFLKHSFSPWRSDGIGRLVGLLLLGLGIISLVVSFVVSKDIVTAFSSMTGLLVLSAPVSSTVAIAVPFMLTQRKAGKHKAVVAGWTDIEALNTSNVMIADAMDLFPDGSIQFLGIKTFKKERIDLAILYAASILSKGCKTLGNIFLDVIQNRAEILFEVDNLIVEHGKGFEAWVDGNRVLVGTKSLLREHGIAAPDQDVEAKHIGEDRTKSAVYIAVEGEIYAAFFLQYTANEQVADMLDSLKRAEISVLVKSNDMNVNYTLLETIYGLSRGDVRILDDGDIADLEPFSEYTPESAAPMAHTGSFLSMGGGLLSALFGRKNAYLEANVQLASVIIAILFSILLIIFDALSSLSLVAVLLYQLSWSLIAVLIPFFKKN